LDYWFIEKGEAENAIGFGHKSVLFWLTGWAFTSATSGAAASAAATAHLNASPLQLSYQSEVFNPGSTQRVTGLRNG